MLYTKEKDLIKKEEIIEEINKTWDLVKLIFLEQEPRHFEIRIPFFNGRDQVKLETIKERNTIRKYITDAQSWPSTTQNKDYQKRKEERDQE